MKLARSLKWLFLFMVFLAAAAGATYLSLTFLIRGAETVVVPELVNKDILYALEILTDLDLNIKVKGSEYSDTISKNHVIFQDPPPGAEIKKDRDVRLIVSKGSQQVPIPNLKRLTVQQAKLILEDNGLCAGRLSFLTNALHRSGDIIAQQPPAGDVVQRGQCIDLLISSGQPPLAYKMPDLSGRALDDAILIIERHRLGVGEISARPASGRPVNVVIEQHPSAGQRVTEGSTVRLVVNRTASPNGQDLLQSALGVHLFRYRAPAGFLNRKIRLKLTIFGISTELYDEYVRPAEEIWVLVPKGVPATLMLYQDHELIQTQLYEG